MPKKSAILWFRQDLRLADNPALLAAAKQGLVLPIYILDESISAPFAMGAASRAWLYHSLKSLNQSLKQNLNLYAGDPRKIIKTLVRKQGADAVFWNRCYEPWSIKRDEELQQELKDREVTCEIFDGSYLWKPWEVLKSDETPYKVFTAFYRRALPLSPRAPHPAPRDLSLCKDRDNKTSLEDLQLLPEPHWEKKFEKYWKFGEKAAHRRLQTFLKQNLSLYQKERDFPGKQSTSRLSPYLHFGELSPHQAWSAIQTTRSKSAQNFLSELGWREFSCYLLYHFPTLHKENIQRRFDLFPWEEDSPLLECWQRGETGYPIVDAGMRELWETGYMHNRVRMIVASFLVKNLLTHWHEGRDWFWDTLVDADLANNSVNWQWVAGSGVDAAPYFRIFNPITQGKKFDPDGAYIKQYVPELANLPTRYLFSPWEAPKSVLSEAKITLGKTYPQPIVDLKKSRERALKAFRSLPKSSEM